MSGRIPRQFIDQLLDRVDIVAVVDARVKLKKAGKEYTACCPFHDEKTPSFAVVPQKQFYHCFGCQKSGNALSFLMDYEHLDFPTAVETLAAMVGLDVPREEGGRSNDGPAKPRAEDPIYKVLEQAAAWFEQQLRSHADAPRAVAYLKGRGLDGRTAKSFRLGFAPPGWQGLEQALALSQGASDGQLKDHAELLVRAGLVIRNDDGRTWDRFRDRIVFPIRDPRGRVIAFGGRVLGDDKPKYLNSPETPVFHKGRELYGLWEARQHSRRLTRLLVVEGYMDVVSLAKAGITEAVATLGTATSREHLEKMLRIVPEVVCVFDGDRAGRGAAWKALNVALPVLKDGVALRFWFLPDGEDPDTLVQSQGADAFRAGLDAAMPAEDLLFQQLSADLDLATITDRARLAQDAAPLIRQLPDGVMKQLLFQRLAEVTGLPEQTLIKATGGRQQQPDKYPRSGGASGAAAATPPPPGADDGFPDYDDMVPMGAAGDGYAGPDDGRHDNDYFPGGGGQGPAQSYQPQPQQEPDWSSLGRKETPGGWGKKGKGGWRQGQGGRGYGARQQPAEPSAAIGGVKSLAMKALGSLLRHPEFASRVSEGTLAVLAGESAPDISLLTECLHILGQNPAGGAALVLGSFAGAPEHRLLLDLSQQEPLLNDAEALATEFDSSLAELLKRCTHSRPRRELLALLREQQEATAERLADYMQLRKG